MPVPEVRWAGPRLVGRERVELLDVVAEVTALGGAVGWVDPPDAAERSRWLDAVLADVAAGESRLALLVLDGAVCGTGLWRQWEAPVLSRVVDIRKVMIVPAARGRGLARVLVQALVHDAEQRDYEIATLDVRGNNHRAQALYESLGFTEVGRLPNSIAVGTQRFDRVAYARELGRPAGAVLHGDAPVGPGSSRVTHHRGLPPPTPRT